MNTHTDLRLAQAMDFTKPKREKERRTVATMQKANASSLPVYANGSKKKHYFCELVFVLLYLLLGFCVFLLFSLFFFSFLFNFLCFSFVSLPLLHSTDRVVRYSLHFLCLGKNRRTAIFVWHKYTYQRIHI